jgi:hypothetical protein
MESVDGNPDYLYTSTDNGVTWATSTAPGLQYWGAVASSADGNKLVAVSNCDAACITGDGTVWTSSDGGATWTEQTAAGMRDWTSVASSADGTTLAAGPYGDTNYLPDYIWTSTDSGVTWTQLTTPGAGDWEGLALSADGTQLVAGMNGANLWTGAAPSISAPPTLPAPPAATGGGGGLIFGSGPLAPGYVNTRPQVIVLSLAPTSTNLSVPSVTLPANQASTTPAIQPTGLVFAKNLQLYDRSEDIRALQKFFNTHGFVIAQSGPGSPGNETSIFGKGTFKTLIKFQKANNLPATGYLGPLTRALINSQAH